MAFFKNIKKIETKPTEPKKPLLSYGAKKRIKKVFLVVGICLVVGLVFTAFYFTSAFFDKHAFRFQTPVIVQSPVIMYDRDKVVQAEVAKKLKEQTKETEVNAVEPTPIPQPKYLNFNLVPKAYASGVFENAPSHENEARIINSYKHASIIWRIYMLESTFGRQDDCVSKGLVNGFGFGINTSEHRCYSSFDAVVSDVNDWIDTQLSNGLDVPTMLCYYNKGIKTRDCIYAQSFLGII